MVQRITAAATWLLALVCAAPCATAADCGHDAGGFRSWLGRFEAKAAAQGISNRTIQSALGSAGYDASVVRLDRSQRSFKLSFEQFYARRVSSSLVRNGQQMLQRHRDLFERIEKRFGVPGPVLVAIWGLETNFGRDRGQNRSIVGSLATLAYDCRRSEFFQKELMSALRIVERGDMTPTQLRGGWAGEIGPMQFLPSSYVKYAVDFDGDGRRDLIHSVPDMLASTGNYLKGYGWQAGQGWGPGSPNYAVLREWNKAEVYVRTISALATTMSRGSSRPGS